MAYHLTHPDSDQEIEVETDQVPNYLTQGWLTKPSAPTPAIPEEQFVSFMPSAKGFGEKLDEQQSGS